MKPSFHPLPLIILGLLISMLAFFNLFLDFPSMIADQLQLARLQQENALQPSPPALIKSHTHYLAVSEFIPATSTPPARLPSPTPRPTEISAYVPDRIVIPAIQLDAPVIKSEVKSVEIRDQWFDQWLAPNEFAAGWQSGTAPLGIPGNTVINGHHNEYGKVFGHLVDLKKGDEISVFSGLKEFRYVVTDILVLQERDVSLSIRQENAHWVSPTDDERLTLVTCWPKRNNTHRLIIVATPVIP
jgi:sortase A